MAYKDPDRQREANRQAQAKRRAKGTTKGMTNQGMTVIDERSNEPSNVIPSCDTPDVIPERTAQGNSEPKTSKEAHKVLQGINYAQPAPPPTTPYPIQPERTAQGNIRVSKPGDADYVPQCETTRAFIEDRPKNTKLPTHKRGKDIKSFADLPPDVQQTIDKMSMIDGVIDRTVKANRTAIAVHYQHLYPGRYYSTGLNL